MKNSLLFKKGLAEFIGAFAIVFFGCGASIVSQLYPESINHLGVSLVFGFVVMIMIYSLGHISGAHFNPAVSLGFSFSNFFPKSQLFFYLFFQFFGACSASFLHYMLFPLGLDMGVTHPYNDLFLTAFLWEFILTFFLMFVIISVATDYRAIGQLAGVAIGGMVFIEALFAGPMSGASMNPARSFGPALVSMQWEHILAYFFGPVLGSFFAVFVYNKIRCEREKDKKQIVGCC